MEKTRFRRLMDVVGEAMQRPEGDRESFLESACGDDEGLLHEARALVADEGGSSPHDVTARVDAVVDRAAAEVIDHGGRRPSRIGPYEIVRLLGRGGMGVVYLGRQQAPLKRDVAIKVVRQGLADGDTLARFESERQALALMQHPNIARVFDAGATDDGLPYFAMELVEGLPITEYCDRERLTLDERLQIFRTVCHAVYHAHQRGVIHRDLKPSNVLVVLVDRSPTPKIIDFGIAKATDGLLSVESVHTRVGSFVGTLDFMSPEQLRGDAAAIDTRSDVYSLGVILYQLVTGRHPFADTTLQSAGLIEAQKILLESDPPRPSWSVSVSEGRDERAHERSTDERTLRRRVREDLDWIVMKALEKDRERRYPSALDLARDLERYARDEPVSAGPPSVSYRARKFVRRHRLGVSATTLIALALFTGTALAAMGFVRANVEARRAQAISAFLTDMLASVRPDLEGRAVTVREVLDDSRTRLEAGEFAEDVETAATLALVIGHSYEGLGQFDDAIALLRRSVSLRERAYGSDDERVWASLYRLGTALWKRGDLEEALELRLRLADMTERMFGAAHRDHAESLSNLANTYADMGEFERAESQLREAVTVGRRLLGEQGELDLARFLNNLGTVLVDLEAYDEAVEAFEETLAIRSRLLGEENDEYAITLTNLGGAELGLEHLESAERTYRRAVELDEVIFGEVHPRTAFAYSGLGSALLRMGRHAEAEEYVRKSLAIRIASSGDNFWRTSLDRRKLAEIMMETGRLEDARVELQRAWDGLAATGVEVSAWGRDVASSMARLQAQLGDDDSAARWAALASAGSAGDPDAR